MDKELIKKIQAAVWELVEMYDNDFDPSFYADCGLDQDADEVLKTFIENYSSRSIGLSEFDTLEADEVLSKLKLTLKTETIAELILKHCDLITADYYTQWNEMYSVQVGEVEHQIDVEYYPHLVELIAQATDEELVEARAERDSFLAYGNPCDRVIWKLDVEQFFDDSKIKAALNRSKLKLA
jgi:desulfoferrodoxin (superoxide reductase-like protein)